jgi:tripeptidyl-peptidase-1
LYKTDWYTPVVPEKNKLGIAGYLGITANQSDLTKFMTLFYPTAAAAQFSVVSVNGGTDNASNPNAEVRGVLASGVYVTKTCDPAG